MTIEVVHSSSGKIVNQVEVNLPEGNSLADHNLRQSIIDYEIQKLRKIYPTENLWLAFESKMNTTILI